jgi:hypothetical protein
LVSVHSSSIYMQSTGQTITHTGHPEHNSGIITTSSPLSNIAPNSGGQLRRQVSQVMHSDASMRRGGFFQASLRDRRVIRSVRPALAVGGVSFAHGILYFPQLPGNIFTMKGAGGAGVTPGSYRLRPGAPVGYRQRAGSRIFSTMPSQNLIRAERARLIVFSHWLHLSLSSPHRLASICIAIGVCSSLST